MIPLRLDPPSRQSHAVQGFSLIEIVIVMGIIAFCVIPLVGSLAVANQTSLTARESMEQALVLQSVQANLRAVRFELLRTNLLQGVTNYYGEGGRVLGTNSSSTSNFYQCAVKLNPTNASSNQIVASLVISFPAPSYSKRVTYPLSFFRYGSQP